MNALQNLLGGFAVAATPTHLLLSLVGVIMGTAIGVLPGLGPSVTIALLLPITFQADPLSAFVLFGGIYYGAMYGGSTTSILLNMPGESSSLMTAIDGHKMARQGRAAAALATAAIGSFVAGTIATFGLAVAAPFVIDIALRFGPAEYFMLAMLAFAATSGLIGSSLLRGGASLCIGILIGFIGLDLQTGQARLTFGMSELADGLSPATVSVGLFAVGEVIYLARHPDKRGDGIVQRIKGRVAMTREDWQRSWQPWLRGTAIGFPLGILPAGGAELPTFLSYSLERMLSKRRQEFGHGAIEGVAGPEAANNASSAGVLLPLLALGLPTSATAAIMLSALQGYGLKPGPMLLQEQPDLVWGFIASLFLGNLFLLVLNLPLAPIWARLLTIPQAPLLAAILVLTMLSVYSVSQSPFDLCLLFGLGFIGYIMKRLDFPATPIIVGMILGPMAEQQFRRALTIGEGSYALFAQPLPMTLALLAISAAVVPAVARRDKRGSRQGH